MAISDLRFPDRAWINRMVAACQLTDVVISKDERGLFASSFEMPAWLAAMPTQDQVDAAIVAQPVAHKERKPPVVSRRESGPCAEIRAWARENTEATKADAIANFPQYNKATVSIQFQKARLGQV